MNILQRIKMAKLAKAETKRLKGERTAEEWARIWKCSVCTAQRHLKAAVELRLMKRRKINMRVSDYVRSVPVFREL